MHILSVASIIKQKPAAGNLPSESNACDNTAIGESEKPMITTLAERAAALPNDLRQSCERIYRIDVMHGRAVVPPSMQPWAEQQFGDVALVRDQTIVKVTNRLTLESALFNPVRARRPNAGAADTAAIERWIAQELAGHDVFADPERDTTADVFGRIRGRYCITASNVAKYDGWHGLVIFDDPHPLHPGPAQIADFVDVALRWVAAAHTYDPAAIYPLITWNCLPKSGATLMHGHMQVALTSGMHFARVEVWRRAAETYRAAANASYLADLFELHAGLGLQLPALSAPHAAAHLTPLRNRELLIAAPAAEQIAAPLAAGLRALIDRLGVRAFNVAIALPPLVPTAEDWRDMPVIARIADRGNPLTNRSDVGAMELFAAGCITADPFELVAALQ